MSDCIDVASSGNMSSSVTPKEVSASLPISKSCQLLEAVIEANSSHKHDQTAKTSAETLRIVGKEIRKESKPFKDQKLARSSLVKKRKITKKKCYEIDCCEEENSSKLKGKSQNTAKTSVKNRENTSSLHEFQNCKVVLEPLNLKVKKSNSAIPETSAGDDNENYPQKKETLKEERNSNEKESQNVENKNLTRQSHNIESIVNSKIVRKNVIIEHSSKLKELKDKEREDEQRKGLKDIQTSKPDGCTVIKNNNKFDVKSNLVKGLGRSKMDFGNSYPTNLDASASYKGNSSNKYSSSSAMEGDSAPSAQNSASTQDILAAACSAVGIDDDLGNLMDNIDSHQATGAENSNRAVGNKKHQEFTKEYVDQHQGIIRTPNGKNYFVERGGSVPSRGGHRFPMNPSYPSHYYQSNMQYPMQSQRAPVHQNRNPMPPMRHAMHPIGHPMHSVRHTSSQRHHMQPDQQRMVPTTRVSSTAPNPHHDYDPRYVNHDPNVAHKINPASHVVPQKSQQVPTHQSFPQVPPTATPHPRAALPQTYEMHKQQGPAPRYMNPEIRQMYHDRAKYFEQYPRRPMPNNYQYHHTHDNHPMNQNVRAMREPSIQQVNAMHKQASMRPSNNRVDAKPHKEVVEPPIPLQTVQRYPTNIQLPHEDMNNSSNKMPKPSLIRRIPNPAFPQAHATQMIEGNGTTTHPDPNSRTHDKFAGEINMEHTNRAYLQHSQYSKQVNYNQRPSNQMTPSSNFHARPPAQEMQVQYPTHQKYGHQHNGLLTNGPYTHKDSDKFGHYREERNNAPNNISNQQHNSHYLNPYPNKPMEKPYHPSMPSPNPDIVHNQRQYPTVHKSSMNEHCRQYNMKYDPSRMFQSYNNNASKDKVHPTNLHYANTNDNTYRKIQSNEQGYPSHPSLHLNSAVTDRSQTTAFVNGNSMPNMNRSQPPINHAQYAQTNIPMNLEKLKTSQNNMESSYSNEYYKTYQSMANKTESDKINLANQHGNYSHPSHRVENSNMSSHHHHHSNDSQQSDGNYPYNISNSSDLAQIHPHHSYDKPATMKCISDSQRPYHGNHPYSRAVEQENTMRSTHTFPPNRHYANQEATRGVVTSNAVQTSTVVVRNPLATPQPVIQENASYGSATEWNYPATQSASADNPSFAVNERPAGDCRMSHPSARTMNATDVHPRKRAYDPKVETPRADPSYDQKHLHSLPHKKQKIHHTSPSSEYRNEIENRKEQIRSSQKEVRRLSIDDNVNLSGPQNLVVHPTPNQSYTPENSFSNLESDPYAVNTPTNKLSKKDGDELFASSARADTPVYNSDEPSSSSYSCEVQNTVEASKSEFDSYENNQISNSSDAKQFSEEEPQMEKSQSIHDIPRETNEESVTADDEVKRSETTDNFLKLLQPVLRTLLSAPEALSLRSLLEDPDTLLREMVLKWGGKPSTAENTLERIKQNFEVFLKQFITPEKCSEWGWEGRSVEDILQLLNAENMSNEDGDTVCDNSNAVESISTSIAERGERDTNVEKQDTKSDDGFTKEKSENISKTTKAPMVSPDSMTSIENLYPNTEFHQDVSQTATSVADTTITTPSSCSPTSTDQMVFFPSKSHSPNNSEVKDTISSSGYKSKFYSNPREIIKSFATSTTDTPSPTCTEYAPLSNTSVESYSRQSPKNSSFPVLDSSPQENKSYDQKEEKKLKDAQTSPIHNDIAR